MDRVIGIGEIGIITNPNDRLITHALASCVAVVLFSERPRIGAMIHIALPEAPEHSKYDSPVVYDKPGYYANLGLPKMLRELVKEYKCDLSKAVVHLVGGAESATGVDYFGVSKRNVEAVQTILSKWGIAYQNDEIGGQYSRTVTFDLDKGVIEINYQKILI